MSNNWKTVQDSAIFFQHRVAKPFQFFRIKRHGNIPTWTLSLTGASNAGVEGTNREWRRAGYWSMTCWTCEQLRRIIYRSLQHARLRRRQENRTVYAALNLKQNLPSTYCSIEANDRHEASRGLFATAELLVQYRQWTCNVCSVRRCDMHDRRLKCVVDQNGGHTEHVFH